MDTFASALQETVRNGQPCCC